MHGKHVSSSTTTPPIAASRAIARTLGASVDEAITRDAWQKLPGAMKSFPSVRLVILDFTCRA